MAEFQNPQNEPGTEKRLLLVFALTFLVILVFQPLLKKYLPQPPAPVTQNQPVAKVLPGPANPEGSQVQGTTPPVVSLQASAETETVIESDLYRVTFTNRGGQVKSWILKQYDDDHGKPLDLVNNSAAPKYGNPLSLWTYDESLRNKLSSALYVASVSGPVAAPVSLSFEYSDQGLTVRKSFRFDHTYVVKVETSVLSNGSQVSAFPAWPAGFGDETDRTAYNARGVGVEYHNDESTERSWGVFPKSTERLPIKSVSGGKTLLGPLNWAGTVDQYFAAIFIPDDPRNAALVTLRNALDIPKRREQSEAR